MVTKTCFVVMCIGEQKLDGIVIKSEEQLKNDYDNLIKEAILKARPHLEVTRADEIPLPGTITKDIIKKIKGSDYVIADVTYPNPNVFYELGLRHACRLGTIIIKEKNSPRVPFDITHLRYIEYENTTAGLKELSEKLELAFTIFEQNPNHPDNQFLEQGEPFLDARNASGISTVFPSRKSNESIFHEAVDNASDYSKKIDLLGVSFRSLFDPNQNTHTRIKGRLASPDVELRILLLNNKSPAAERRNTIERGTIIQDIENTLQIDIPDLVNQRIHESIRKNGNFENVVKAAQKGDDTNLDKLITKLKLHVHLYDHDPIMFLMLFDDSLFTEQYHFGRPPGLFERRCIGKYVPVIQYAKAAEAYKYLLAHFKYEWKENSTDFSRTVVRAGLQEFKKTGCVS